MTELTTVPHGRGQVTRSPTVPSRVSTTIFTRSTISVLAPATRAAFRRVAHQDYNHVPMPRPEFDITTGAVVNSLTLLSEGGAADRRLRARYRSRRVDAAGDAGHPRPRPDRGAERHDPALPELLGDLRHALMALRIQIMDMLPLTRPLDAQMSNLPGSAGQRGIAAH
jgi:hypothetical protein